MLICDMVAFGVRAEAKIFEAAYGEPSGQKYWDARIGTVRDYARRVLRLKVADQAVRWAARTGASGFSRCSEAGERWFTDTHALWAAADGQTNFEGLAKIKLITALSANGC